MSNKECANFQKQLWNCTHTINFDSSLETPSGKRESPEKPVCKVIMLQKIMIQKSLEKLQSPVSRKVANNPSNISSTVQRAHDEMKRSLTRESKTTMIRGGMSNQTIIPTFAGVYNK